MARLLNLGSLNIDHTYRVKRLAAAGETVPVFALERHIGGKGLNQSAAYARAGGKVFHGGKIGPDGLFLKQFLQDEGVDTGHVLETGSVTGHAVIQVDEEGRNGILVYGGANRELTENEIDGMLAAFGPGDALLLQNEVNLTAYAAKRAKERGMLVILNPSPVEDLEVPFALVDWFLLNEHEAVQLFGSPQDDFRAELLPRLTASGLIPVMQKTCPQAKFVLTLGETGAVCFDSQRILYREAFSVEAADTTGAGDTFTGYFLQSILAGGSPEEALLLASKAAALAVTRPGAAEAIPRAEEVRTAFL
ncbi:MAG: ribokinase [Clostridiales bacterium]|nr:ribokinase [Clostridiales bacterium]